MLSTTRLSIVIFLILSFGLLFFNFLPIELKPNAEYPQLNISFSAQAYAPDMLERQITSKIEAAVSALPNIQNVSSRSYNGFGQITVKIERNISLAKRCLSKNICLQPQ